MRKLRANASRSTRTAAGREFAGDSVDIRWKSDFDERRRRAPGDDSVRADADRNERGLAARERADLLASAPSADVARDRMQTMRARIRHVDGETRRRLEMLEPKVLAIDGAADSGPHLLRFDDEVLRARRCEIHGLERVFDVELAQRKAHVVPGAERRPRTADLEREHGAPFRIAERMDFGRSRLAARRYDARRVRVVNDVSGFDGNGVQRIEHGPVRVVQVLQEFFGVGPVRIAKSLDERFLELGGTRLAASEPALEQRLQLVGRFGTEELE